MLALMFGANIKNKIQAHNYMHPGVSRWNQG